MRSLTSSTFRLGMWKNDNSSLSLTCVCRSGKQSLMFRSTSALSCEQIELPVQLSFDVPSLLCSHNDVSLSLTFAILESFASRGRRTSSSPQPRHVRFPATRLCAGVTCDDATPEAMQMASVYRRWQQVRICLTSGF